MKRSLSLKREALTELTPRDLTAVVGGAAQTNEGFTCPLARCADTSELLGCLFTRAECETNNC